MSDRQDDELTRNNSKMLEIALANRKEEIDRFWSRSSFYWVIVAAAFGGYAATENSDDLIRQIIASFGLIGSLAWMLTNIASKQWQAVWEEKLITPKSYILGILHLFQVEGCEGHGKSCLASNLL